MKYLLPILLLTACTTTKAPELDPVKTNQAVMSHAVYITKIANCLSVSKKFEDVKGCLLAKDEGKK